MGIHFNHKSKAGDRKMQKELKLKMKAEARKKKREERMRQRLTSVGSLSNIVPLKIDEENSKPKKRLEKLTYLKHATI